ncbi:MAG: hypothetical protein KDA22_10585 [Phycisphaerales bacterium]|nr:hypothetical protein [Phycisphaerales bacterium]
MRRSHSLSSMLALVLGTTALAGGLPFSDDFASGPSELWGNEVGAWSAPSGAYLATQPDNFPNAYSSLPFELEDFSIDMDVSSISDGGIWLRSAAAPGSAVGIKGVLLVTGAGSTGGTGAYWHIVADGAGYGSIINGVAGLFPAGGTAHFRIEVRCGTYLLFVNGSDTPATSVTTDLFPTGRVALYSNSATQAFDNVLLAEIPFVCPADLNCDGAIDGADLGILLGAWGDPGATDLDGNGTTDGADLGLLLGAWGQCEV